MSYIKTDYLKKNIERLAIVFLVCYIAMPQYFGVELPFFDFTVQRIMVVVFLLIIIEKKKRLFEIYNIVRNCKFYIVMTIYLLICLMTGVRRGHVGSFAYPLMEFVAFFITIYIFINVLEKKRTIKTMIVIIYVLCILGCIEFVMRQSPFVYLETIKGVRSNAMIRSGAYRIMGPAGHSLAYGLMLNSFIIIACVDFEEDKIDLLKNKLLLLLLVINVFLTGSRSTLAIMFLELGLLFLFSDIQTKKRTGLYLFAFVVVLALIIIIFYNTSLSRYILLQITSVIDEAFDTTYSIKYGADVTTLSNSSSYREILPRIFTIESLNPLLGRGSGYHFTWYVDGVSIKSIDNFYVAEYIRYAYPGLIAYILMIIVPFISMVKDYIKYKSGISMAMACGLVCYYFNLWYMDHLQTLKYAYLLIAIYYSFRNCGRTNENSIDANLNKEKKLFKFIKK